MVFKELLCLTVAVGFVAAKVPSYIHVCDHKSPNFDDCIIKSVEALNDKLRAGIPELDVPPIDPLYLDEVVLNDMPNFKAVATNITLRGLGDYHVDHLHFDLENKRIDLVSTFAKIVLDSQYHVKARILIPLEGKGPAHITTNNVVAKVKMIFKIIEHGGKRYLFFPSMTTHLTVNDFTAEFKTEGLDNVALQQAVTQALGNSHKEILEATTPNIEKAISQRVLQMSNQICKHITYEELFPEV